MSHSNFSLLAHFGFDLTSRLESLMFSTESPVDDMRDLITRFALVTLKNISPQFLNFQSETWIRS